MYNEELIEVSENNPFHKIIYKNYHINDNKAINIIFMDILNIKQYLNNIIRNAVANKSLLFSDLETSFGSYNYNVYSEKVDSEQSRPMYLQLKTLHDNTSYVFDLWNKDYTLERINAVGNLLWNVYKNNITMVFHNGDNFDIPILYNFYGAYNSKFNDILDKISFIDSLKYYKQYVAVPGERKSNLAYLMKKMYNITISKSGQKDDFTKRPATKDQIIYSGLDPIYLEMIYAKMANIDSKIVSSTYKIQESKSKRYNIDEILSNINTNETPESLLIRVNSVMQREYNKIETLLKKEDINENDIKQLATQYNELENIKKSLNDLERKVSNTNKEIADKIDEYLQKHNKTDIQIDDKWVVEYKSTYKTNPYPIGKIQLKFDDMVSIITDKYTFIDITTAEQIVSNFFENILSKAKPTLQNINSALEQSIKKISANNPVLSDKKTVKDISDLIKNQITNKTSSQRIVLSERDNQHVYTQTNMQTNKQNINKELSL